MRKVFKSLEFIVLITAIAFNALLITGCSDPSPDDPPLKTNAVAVTDVSLNKHSTTIIVGGTETFTATITPTGATNQNVNWSSSNTNVATVNNGTVTAVSVGTATITVTTVDGNKTANCTVTVSTTEVAVTSVSLKSSTIITVGLNEILTATITPTGATNQNVNWSSSNTAVATVNNGTVTAVSAGTATITVTTVDGNKTATCSVTVTNWSVWRDESSSATLNYSIDNNEVCTVIVGGTPEKNGVDGVWRAWTIQAFYPYTGEEGMLYEYKFEAWTQSGTRDLHIQYYENNEDAVYLGDTIPITTKRTTYTVRGRVLPKDFRDGVHFQLADQIGTVSIKMLEIKELKIGKLTITNFSNSPGMTQGSYIWGDNTNTLIFTSNAEWFDSEDGEGVAFEVQQINGNTIILPVWEVNFDNKTCVPYTGNTTVNAGSLYINIANEDDSDIITYVSTGDIKFTNGNATINFGTQMKKHISP